MKYNYNGNLTFEERIEEVSIDIIKKYNNISIEDAMVIASLEGPITTCVTDEIKFKRLYNIIFVINSMYDEVYKDILKLDISNEVIKSGIIRLNEFKEKGAFPIYTELFK